MIVTGAGGFIGRAVVRELASHEVVAIDTQLGGIDGIEGDLRDPAVLAAAFQSGCDAVIHLATVPGGAAERDPDLAWRVNVDATRALIAAAGATAHCPRFVFASSVAVFGDPLPAAVDDRTPPAPKMYYGAHKLMMEAWLATMTRRGAVHGLSLRLPGIVARPRAPSGMKSAFLSDLFHALLAGDLPEMPVSAGATSWLMSVSRVAANLRHAVEIDAVGSLTLPALRTAMGDLIATVAARAGGSTPAATWQPDADMETMFGSHPPLLTPVADQLGFSHDGDLEALVETTLTDLRTKELA